MDCPECGTENQDFAINCRRCKTLLKPELHDDLCHHPDGCASQWMYQIAGQKVCLVHYLDIQERNPQWKPATVLAVEMHLLEHPEYHDAEVRAEIFKRASRQIAARTAQAKGMART